MRRLRIGLDLGSRSVKVAWLALNARGGLAWHGAERPLDPAGPPEQAAEALGELLRPLRRRRHDVPVITAAPQSHVRQLAVQVSSAKQIPSLIREHIPKLFPFEVSRCRFDYRMLSQQAGGGQLSGTVQIAACDLDAIERDLAACWRSGWIPSRAYPTALAVAALAAAQGLLGQDPALLLRLGARRSTLALMLDGAVVFAREVALGSDDVTEALTSRITIGQQVLQLTWQEAERLKCEVGLPEGASPVELLGGRLPAMTYAALLQPVLEQWIGEIQRTVASGTRPYGAVARVGQPSSWEAADRMAEGAVAPRRVLLCGGGSQMAGLDRWLTRQLAVPVERVSLEPVFGEERPTFAVACGLLMADGITRFPLARRSRQSRATSRMASGALSRRIPNLLPERSRRIRRLVRLERMAINGLLLAWLGVGVATALLVGQREPLRQQLAPVEDRWQALAPVTALAQARASYAELVSGLSSSGGVSAGWLKRLSREFPRPVRLTELLVDSVGDVQVKGQAQAREQTPEAYASEFAMWLEQARLCADVRLDSSERSQRDSQLVEFSLRCRCL